MAEALAWDHRHRQALIEYDLILQRDPNDVIALLGKAEVLSWDDQLEKANAIYEKVLALDARNLSAENGLARNLVWQGYHRQGSSRYLKTLKEQGDNPDSLEGLAFAYHWDGQEREALRTLEKLLSAYPQRDKARDLHDQIRGLKAFHADESNRYSQDSNKLAISLSRAHGRQFLTDSVAVGTTYELASYRQPGQPALKAQRGGMDLQERFNEYWEANSYLYVTKYNAKEFTPFTTDTWLTFRPDDLWRMDLGYDRETFEDIKAIHQGIIVNSGSLSVDFRPDRFWLFSSKYKRGFYSDDNKQDTFFSKIEFRLKQNPYVKLYMNDYFSQWGEQRDNGYFNPRSIHSDVIGIYASEHLTRQFFVEGQASCGYEKQNPKSDHPTYYSAFGLVYRLPGNWSTFLRGEYFIAQDANPTKDYSKYSTWLGMSYNFGPEPKRAYEGQQSQRPIAR